MEQVCRVCTSSSVALVDIFAQREQLEEEEQEPCLAEMLNECVDWNVRPDDPFPKQICLSCVFDTQTAFKLKRRCQQSHQHFCELLRIKVEDEVNEFQVIFESNEDELVNEDISITIDQGNLEMQETIVERLPAYTNFKDTDTKDEYIIVDYKSYDTKVEHINANYKSSNTKYEHINADSKSSDTKFEHITADSNSSTSQKTFPCYTCGEEFPNKEKLIEHAFVHISENPNKCPHCPKTFANPKKLKKHFYVHFAERLHKCSYCEKDFANKSHLENHIRIHTGERPHKCPHCNKGFIEKHKLANHMRIHVGEHHYQCPHCK